MTALPLPEALVGEGFYKLGYVTRDRDEAIALLQERYGFEEFVPFSPSFEAVLPDGRRGPAQLDCAFSAGRDTVLEVMQPVSGLVDLWADLLAGEGPPLRFHHVGLVASDIEAVNAAAAAHGLTRVLEARVEDRFAFSYHALPELGHYVEHIQYFGDAGSFLDSVRTRPVRS
jgi:hypothetical protein